MASSDNVLRAGLTPKHVDAAELMRITDFTPRPIPVVVPEYAGPIAVYRPGAAEFELAYVTLGADDGRLARGAGHRAAHPARPGRRAGGAGRRAVDAPTRQSSTSRAAALSSSPLRQERCRCAGVGTAVVAGVPEAQHVD